MQNIAEQSCGRLAIGNIELEYQWFEAVRPRKGSVIVMLHEGLGSISMWKSFPQHLADRTGLTVLAYSRQGYGASSKFQTKRNVEYMRHEAEVILPQVLTALDIKNPILLGHSDGASIALLFAMRYFDETKALILEAPHVFVEDITVESIRRAKIAYETTDLRQKLSRYHVDVDNAFWGWNDIWLNPEFAKWNIERDLKHVVCPVLMIQGQEDEYGTEAQLDAISAKISSTKTVLLENCRHSPHRDQQRKTLDAIATFLTGAAT